MFGAAVLVSTAANSQCRVSKKVSSAGHNFGAADPIPTVAMRVSNVSKKVSSVRHSLGAAVLVSTAACVRCRVSKKVCSAGHSSGAAISVLMAVRDCFRVSTLLSDAVLLPYYWFGLPLARFLRPLVTVLGFRSLFRALGSGLVRPFWF